MPNTLEDWIAFIIASILMICVCLLLFYMFFGNTSDSWPSDGMIIG